VQYFNKYAYCYVAAYGLGFVESAKKVTQLFTDRLGLELGLGLELLPVLTLEKLSLVHTLLLS
jgi:hypothetical protein